MVVDPLQGKGGADATLTSPLNVKQEEPTSTVELATNSHDEGSSSTDCVSPDLDEIPGPDSSPSVMVSASPDSIPSVNVMGSVPSVTVSTSASSAGIKEPPRPHSMSSTGTGDRKHSSSSSSSIPSSSTSPMKPVSPPPTKSTDFNHSNCLPDSTTRSSISSSSSQPVSHKGTSDPCKMNHAASGSDQGYHSVSSNGGGGGQMIASVGNESDVSGASSCVYRSSPESTQYPPYSPDYPQSVFSSDGSLPPPALSHVDSPDSNQSKPACGTTVLHHPPNGQLSHDNILTPGTQPVKQPISLTPVTPVMPMKQVTPRHQIQSSSGSYPQHFIRGQPIHRDNFGMHTQASHHHQQLGRTEGRRTVIVGNGYGAPQLPQYNYTVRQNQGANPGNHVFSTSNANQMGMTFVKTEPPSPQYYAPPYVRGHPAPQSQLQGTAAIFTGPHYPEGRGIHHQSVGAQILTASATGKGRNSLYTCAVDHSKLTGGC